MTLTSNASGDIGPGIQPRVEVRSHPRTSQSREATSEAWRRREARGHPDTAPVAVNPTHRPYCPDSLDVPARPRKSLTSTEAEARPQPNVMITRRVFIGASAAALVGRQSESAAQPKVPRIGVLVGATPPHPFAVAFRRGLQTLGYQEGQNIALEISLHRRAS